MFQSAMRIGFTIAIVIITLDLVVSLLIWLFGAKKKSEKAIKFGIRNFVVFLILIFIILAVPMIVSMF